MEILKPYRAQIDAIDREMIALLRRRYDVIEAVGVLKAQHGIPPVLPDRVEQVRENAAKMAADLGLDANFVRSLYDQIIQHSCGLEERIKQSLSQARTG